MGNPYNASLKKFSIMMATGYIVYETVSEHFAKCRCRSMVIDSMHLHFVEMPEKKKIQAEEKVNRALGSCPIGGLEDLQADVSSIRTKENLKMVFTTGGYGDITADVDQYGNVRIKRS